MPDPINSVQHGSEEQSSSSFQSSAATSISQQQDSSLGTPSDQLTKSDLFRRPQLYPSGTSGSTISQDSTTVPLSPKQIDSTKHIQDPPLETAKRKRPRVSKACTYCRKKKVKCDGSLPCLNCQENNEGDCVYVSDPEKKPKAPKPSPSIATKPNKTQSIKHLNSRLDKIESLLEVLAEEVRGARNSAGDNQARSEPVDIKEIVTTHTEESGKKDEPNGDTTNDILTAPLADNNRFGTHTIIDVFSKSSLELMFQGLGRHRSTEVRDVLSIGTIHSFFSQAFMDSICQPIKTTIRNRTDLMDNTFTELSVPLEILDRFDDLYIASFVCESSYVKGLFESYFKNNKKMHTKGPNSKLRSFMWSELMIMSLSVGLCISALVDERNIAKMKKNNKPPSKILQSLTDKQLVELDTKCFFSTVFYYNRLVLSSEGVETVLAFALFVIYLQSVIAAVKQTYIPISLAVRYAQELGLHCKESYQGLSWHERNMRKRLWWFCQTFEVTYSFRYGKPLQAGEYGVCSVIDGDKSTMTNVQSSIELMRTLWDDAKRLDNLSNLNELNEKKVLHRCAAYFLHQITKMRLQSFDQLYSISARHIKLDELLARIENINREMHKITDLAEPSVTICYYNDPRFFYKSKNKPLDKVLAADSGDDNFINIYMNYFSHLMVVNRTAMQEVPATEENEPLIEKIKAFRHISLESARTILHVAKSFNLKTMYYSSFSWHLYDPFAAFCHLASVHFTNPNSAEAERDLGLMIEISLQFFSYKNKSKGVKIQRNCIRQKMYDFITRYLLRIFMNITSGDVKNALFTKNKALQKHFDLKVQFPEFYTPEGHLGINHSLTSKVFERWFRAYNFFDTASESGSKSSYTSEGSNTSKTNSSSNSTVNSTRNSTRSSNRNSNSNVSTDASSEVDNNNAIDVGGGDNDKYSAERRVDSILKNAISPSTSTKARTQEHENHLTDFADQQRKQQYPLHFTNTASVYRPRPVAPGQSFASQDKQPEENDQFYQQSSHPHPHPHPNPTPHNQQPHHPDSHQQSQMHQPLETYPQQHQQQQQPTLQHQFQQQPLPPLPPQQHQHHYMTNYVPRYSDTSSTVSHHSHYPSNSLPQVYPVEMQQPFVQQQQQQQQQQQNFAPTPNQQNSQLKQVMPMFFESIGSGASGGLGSNATSDVMVQLGKEYPNGSNVTNFQEMFDECSNVEKDI
ncbi:hypothetical protein CANMA_002723 [Candida margitis]|uniref:uncharacterized protein n=1 Tax=Candida margitis TaxID=1775924 RepID=UPI002227817E|nr:uncharacterized protein CANMA_002723 [Candida margitis]KAI5967955.1 hypothetical protein CANMA_002723 [Candida margitis]